MNKIKGFFSKDKTWDIITLLPIIFFICIVPMLMGLKTVELKGPVMDYWITEDVNYSLFSYIKANAIIITSLFSLLVLIIRIIIRKTKFTLNIYIILAFLYGVFIVIASNFSKYIYLPMSGAPDRYEGMYVLLSYVFMFIYTILFIDSFKKVKIIIYSFIISICIMTFVGTFEFFGFHLIEIDFIRNILNFSQSTAIHLGNQLSTSLSFYSVNYVGQYLTLIIPFILLAFLSLKKLKYRIAFGLISYFALMCVFGSYSLAAFMAIVIALIIFILLFRKIIIKKWKSLVILIVFLLLASYITNIFTTGLITKKSNALSIDRELQVNETRTSKIKLNDINIENNLAYIDTDSTDFYVLYENSTFIIQSSDKQPLPIKYDEEKKYSYIDLDKYEDYRFEIINEEARIKVMFEGSSFYLKEYLGTFKVIAFKFYLLDVVKIEKTKFQFPDYLFSSRGIIYNGLLPSIRDNLLFGNGPDTTILTYPQNDIIGKINVFRTPIILISKPHSLYIQILHDLGLLAFITFILLIALYAFKSIKLYYNCKMTQKNMLGITLSVSIFSYLVAAFCYDSTVHISPIFWILLAIGIIVNNIIEE